MTDLENLTCDRCQVGDDTVTLHRQRTHYYDDASNWVTLCSDCRTDNDEYWDEMWADYYRGGI